MATANKKSVKISAARKRLVGTQPRNRRGEYMRRSRGAAATAKPGFWARLWAGIKHVCKSVWDWLMDGGLTWLLNVILLIAIIVLFAILLARVVERVRPNTVADNRAVVARTAMTAQAAPAPVIVKVPAIVTIDTAKNQLNISVPLAPIAKPIIQQATTPVMPNATRGTVRPAIAHKPLVANIQSYNDNVFDGARSGDRIRGNMQYNGNVYLQNMRFYTLPCGTTIMGDLVLRNVGMLRFCGAFTVRGNIIVSGNSSFGTIPGNARIGGRVIL